MAAIREIGALDYSSVQVEAWATRHRELDGFTERTAQGALIWVACVNRNEPAAYTLLERNTTDQGHLDMLYCHPDHAGAGLARLLLTYAENHACAAGIQTLITEASEAARPVFARAGYTMLHRRDFEIEHEGRVVPIHNYAMEKVLA